MIKLYPKDLDREDSEKDEGTKKDEITKKDELSKKDVAAEWVFNTLKKCYFKLRCQKRLKLLELKIT